MGSATVDFTETGKSAKYKAYVYDSCGNEESGSWAGTACTDCGSFTSSGHVITITGPTKEGVSGSYTITWSKSSRVTTTHTITVNVDIEKQVVWVFTRSDGTTGVVTNSAASANAGNVSHTLHSTKDGALYTDITLIGLCDWVTYNNMQYSSAPSVIFNYTVTANDSTEDRTCDFTYKQVGSDKTLSGKIVQQGKPEVVCVLTAGSSSITANTNSGGGFQVTSTADGLAELPTVQYDSTYFSSITRNTAAGNAASGVYVYTYRTTGQTTNSTAITVRNSCKEITITAKISAPSTPPSTPTYGYSISVVCNDCTNAKLSTVAGSITIGGYTHTTFTVMCGGNALQNYNSNLTMGVNYVITVSISAIICSGTKCGNQQVESIKYVGSSTYDLGTGRGTANIINGGSFVITVYSTC